MSPATSSECKTQSCCQRWPSEAERSAGLAGEQRGQRKPTAAPEDNTFTGRRSGLTKLQSRRQNSLGSTAAACSMSESPRERLRTRVHLGILESLASVNSKEVILALKHFHAPSVFLFCSHTVLFAFTQSTQNVLFITGLVRERTSLGRTACVLVEDSSLQSQQSRLLTAQEKLRKKRDSPKERFSDLTRTATGLTSVFLEEVVASPNRVELWQEEEEKRRKLCGQLCFHYSFFAQ